MLLLRFLGWVIIKWWFLTFLLQWCFAPAEASFFGVFFLALVYSIFEIFLPACPSFLFWSVELKGALASFFITILTRSFSALLFNSAFLWGWTTLVKSLLHCAVVNWRSSSTPFGTLILFRRDRPWVQLVTLRCFRVQLCPTFLRLFKITKRELFFIRWPICLELILWKCRKGALVEALA